ncbi:MAG: preprotein translocase subunit SecG [Bacteroidaceae bacterium]|nr:preprotein translocase subunit SecG [Bacteroidaceae bacterium]
MFTFFVLLIVLASILMCLIVLIQNSKGGGLASGFASSNQIMGVRKTTDFLEKATWTIAVLMVAFSIFSAHALSSEKASEQATEISYSDASGNNAAAPTFPVEE